LIHERDQGSLNDGGDAWPDETSTLRRRRTQQSNGRGRQRREEDGGRRTMRRTITKEKEKKGRKASSIGGQWRNPTTRLDSAMSSMAMTTVRTTNDDEDSIDATSLCCIVPGRVGGRAIKVNRSICPQSARATRGSGFALTPPRPAPPRPAPPRPAPPRPAPPRPAPPRPAPPRPAPPDFFGLISFSGGNAFLPAPQH
jgi:hypothetical protein